MKRRLTKTLLLAALCIAGLLCGLWCWQANFASRSLVIHVPLWVRGGKETIRDGSQGIVSYQIGIGKNQLHPYGTLWKTTSGLYSETVDPWKKLKGTN